MFLLRTSHCRANVIARSGAGGATKHECHCERSEVPLFGTPLMSGTQERGNPDKV